jgi:hypothetical protein
VCSDLGGQRQLAVVLLHVLLLTGRVVWRLLVSAKSGERRQLVVLVKSPPVRRWWVRVRLWWCCSSVRPYCVLFRSSSPLQIGCRSLY